eukprot:9502643-Pyramimonas_sp.AAC.1
MNCNSSRDVRPIVSNQVYAHPRPTAPLCTSAGDSSDYGVLRTTSILLICARLARRLEDLKSLSLKKRVRSSKSVSLILSGLLMEGKRQSQ